MKLTQQQFLDAAKKDFRECLALLDTKNHDYSDPEDALANFRSIESWGVKGIDGLKVRISDKLNRFKNLQKKEGKVVDETMRDTVHDLINYLEIFLIYSENE